MAWGKISGAKTLGSTIWNPKLRIVLIAGGLAVALSGCHYYPGYYKGGFAYHGGGYHGGYSRGFQKKRFGFRRGHRFGGWRGRY